jgi:CheY-like chemotaxis protein
MKRGKDVVLLVDDDYAALFIAECLIKKHRETEYVLKAHNGLEAIRLIQSACSFPSKEGMLCPTIILLDVHMPVMNGYEFLEALGEMELPSRPLIIMLTSSNHERDLSRARDLNVDGNIRKPLTSQSLRDFLPDWDIG